ncbi:hypothetical protein ILUMI_04401 [Ignelater luminosus]|uniref:Transposase n=1 Tax=Ignelater luminosus TaxID=2038154 RepID=A0A8K0GEL1_IGNLU|nr:hypothetical protein ILUMI_04401 [Ignelater luminosus]
MGARKAMNRIGIVNTTLMKDEHHTTLWVEPDSGQGNADASSEELDLTELGAGKTNRGFKEEEKKEGERNSDEGGGREADAGAPMIPLSKVQQRVSAATGISLRTINRIAKEGREIEKGEKPSFSTPNKIRKNRKSKAALDDFDKDIWFQTGGAPTHNVRRVKKYLNENFPRPWIWRGGEISWPVRSSDQTPMDFFYWRYIKTKVFDGMLVDFDS